jgi:hypothetical protein
MHEARMTNTSEFSVISIAAILAVSPTTVTLAARLNGIVLSIRIIVKAYPIAKASPTANTSVVIMFQPSIKPIAAPIPSPTLQPIKHLRACFAVCYRKLLLLTLLLCGCPTSLSL